MMKYNHKNHYNKLRDCLVWLRDGSSEDEQYLYFDDLLDNLEALDDIACQQIIDASGFGIRNAEFFGDYVGRWDD